MTTDDDRLSLAEADKADLLIVIGCLSDRIDIMREALECLRDCNFVITPADRMDAVREIARFALSRVDGMVDGVGLMDKWV